MKVIASNQNTSSKLIAAEMATPVALKGRLSVFTGRGSCCNSSKVDVSVNSHSDKGTKNPFSLNAVCGAPPGLPAADVREVERASKSCICLVVTSLLPRKTYDLGHPTNASSCSCTMAPNVTNPTREFSGMSVKDRRMASLSACSSSSGRQVSTTKRNIGGRRACLVGRAYSIVVYWGMSSAGRLVSLISA